MNPQDRNHIETRILVVDDDAAIRALLRTVLRRRGYGVVTAGNGIEALAELGRGRYDLVLLDVMMPGMSGYELIDHLSRHPIAPEPRVLLLTAGVEPRVLGHEMVIGAVAKPFDIARLLEVVAACVGISPVKATIDRLATAAGVSTLN